MAAFFLAPTTPGRQNFRYTEVVVAITTHLGQRGTLVIPAALRRQLGIEEGALLMLEVEGSKLIIRPAKAVPTDRYSPQRSAELILNNAVDAQDYARAREVVRSMGLDPDQVPHLRPDED